MSNLVKSLSFSEGQSIANKAGILHLAMGQAFSGNYVVQVDANGNGSFDDAVDYEINASAPGGVANDDLEVNFNGKDGQGNDIPINQSISFRIIFNKLAETHLVVYDVEGLGGLTITAINGSNKGDSTVYWNDTTLTQYDASVDTAPWGNTISHNTDGTVSNIVNATKGVNSAVTGGVHGWDLVNLNPTSSSGAMSVSNEWGDNRYIDTWVYQQSNSSSGSAAVIADPAYLVNFVTNGGSQVAQQKVVGGAAVANVSSALDGYTLIGWKTASDLSGENYTFGLPVNSDLTLYADWAANSYQIVYRANADDAIGEMPNTVATFDENTMLAKNTFSRAGYEFTGWNTKADGTGTKYVENYEFTPYDFANDTTLFVQWKINHYLISFDNGCTDEEACSDKPADQTVQYNDSATEPSSEPTRSGYIFKGWQVCATDNSYTGENAFYNFADVVTDAIQLCAVWNPEYSVKFVDGDGNVIREETVENGHAAIAPEPSARLNYTFRGWDKTFDKITGDLVVVAIYEENPRCEFDQNIYADDVNCNAPETVQPLIPSAPNTGMNSSEAHSASYIGVAFLAVPIVVIICLVGKNSKKARL